MQEHCFSARLRDNAWTMLTPKINFTELRPPAETIGRGEELHQPRMAEEEAIDLREIYRRRFEPLLPYRRAVWRVLTKDFFQKLIDPQSRVLDLGCGYGEFINHISAAEKFGMDLNPDSETALAHDVKFLEQNCATKWPLADHSLDVIFTSNFFEHLPDKSALARTIAEAARCLRPGGRVIAMGPNIACLGGAYWHFWDHEIPLTHLSLEELMRLHDFDIERAEKAFLPYTLVNQPQYPLVLLRIYLRLPALWRIFGGQFLVIARKKNERLSERANDGRR